MSLIRYTKLTALLLMLWAGGVMAQQANYFQTEVVVASQGASERGRAAAVGLERVLVRLVPYGYPGSRIVRYIEQLVATSPRVRVDTREHLDRAVELVGDGLHRRHDLGVDRLLANVGFDMRGLPDEHARIGPFSHGSQIPGADASGLDENLLPTRQRHG